MREGFEGGCVEKGWIVRGWVSLLCKGEGGCRDQSKMWRGIFCRRVSSLGNQFSKFHGIYVPVIRYESRASEKTKNIEISLALCYTS